MHITMFRNVKIKCCLSETPMIPDFVRIPSRKLKRNEDVYQVPRHKSWNQTSVWSVNTAHSQVWEFQDGSHKSMD